MLKYKILAVLILLGLSHGGVFWLGGEHARKVAAEDKLDQALSMLEDNAKAQKALQDRLDKLPKSEPKIREIVHDNPAPCAMPKPVVDGLHEAIDKANRSRKMP